MAHPRQLEADRQAYSAVGWTLLVGLLLSIAVMVIGLIAAAIAGGKEVTQVYPLNDVLSRLASGKPAAILDTGILLLFATPLVGVLVALVQWIRVGDRVFTLVTAALLVLLAISVVVALH